MFTKQEWKQNLLGCFEILLFMRYGIERFKTSRATAIKSFLIPLALFPIVVAVWVAMSDGFSLSLIISLHSICLVASLVMFLVVVYFLTKQFGREEHFYKFVTIANWFNIPGVLMVMPILFALMAGQDMTALESFAVFITLLGYVYSAFIITHCFRLPWEMGGFIAIVGMAIDQNTLELTLFMRDIIAA